MWWSTAHCCWSWSCPSRRRMETPPAATGRASIRVLILGYSCSQVELSGYQCCGSGSGIRCHFAPGPGSGIKNRFFPGSRISDPGSQPHIFSLKTGPNFFLQHLKNKIIFNLVKFVVTKKGLTTNFFSPLSFVAVFGSGIRDPGSGMGKKSGSGIRDKHPGSATLQDTLASKLSYQDTLASKLSYQDTLASKLSYQDTLASSQVVCTSPYFKGS